MQDTQIIYAVTILFVTVNLVTFIIYGVDKWLAWRGSRRIPESTLLGLAAIGGSIGAWAGMHAWHHKTLHKKFKYGVPLIILLQAAVLFLASCKTKQEAEVLAPPIKGHALQHSPSVFLVMYDAEIGKAPLLKAIKDCKCEIVYDYTIINGMAIKKSDERTLEETMQYFRKVKGVVTVEYDHIYHLTDPVRPREEIR